MRHMTASQRAFDAEQAQIKQLRGSGLSSHKAEAKVLAAAGRSSLLLKPREYHVKFTFDSAVRSEKIGRGLA